jgi:hypothetical protein
MDRQYILEEIKRTSRENGGQVLGQAGFLKETGIKSSDWQKYWVRWGDVVREAGFEANRLQSAYDDETLIAQLISFMRELGHFPVKNELRLKTREDPRFPNDKTFARLGGGLGYQLAARVSSYCANRAGYEDVLNLCAKVSAPQNLGSESDITQDENFGFVYLMKSGRYYKIGRSNAVGRREYELGIQLPERVKVIHRIRTDDPVGIEGYWHKRFEAKRKNGEWFELDTSDVNVFTRRKFM